MVCAPWVGGGRGGVGGKKKVGSLNGVLVGSEAVALCRCTYTWNNY